MDKNERKGKIMKFKRYLENIYRIEMIEEGFSVPMKNREKYKKLNPKTNRIKTFRKTRYIETNIPPEKRSFDNIPKYTDGSLKVRFQDWLEIDTSKSPGKNWGWSKNGKCYGWSHRAIYCFKVGDEIKGGNLCKKVTYPKLSDGSLDFDNGKHEPDFIIKTNKQAEEVAKTFAENVS